MTKKATEQILVAIDIGTTKICVLAGQYTGTELEIIGIGKKPSLGLARGVVVDITLASRSIKQAIREAELMAGVSIESAYIGISGSHITALNSVGMVTIKGRDIRSYDVTQVLAAARTVALPEGQQILHILPQYYMIDGSHKVLDPIGMHGIRLEAYVHLITGSVSSVQNLVRCCEMAGVAVRDIILEPLASAHAVLTADERELGVALLDIGGGTSDFAVYYQTSIRHTHIFPIAGNLFTYDIAQCLQTTRQEAERIKKEYGRVTPIETPQFFEAYSVDEQSTHIIAATDLAFVLESRAHELLLLVKQEIDQFNLTKMMPAGIVLTGGGSLLVGMQELTTGILQIPVRIGRPRVPATFKESLEHPMYATGYGLLLHAQQHLNGAGIQELEGPLIHRVFSRMKSWVGDFF